MLSLKITPHFTRQTDTLFHLKTLSQRRDAEDVTVTHSGHGDHEEVDTVPVAQALLVSEVRGVPAVLKLRVKLLFRCCQHNLTISGQGLKNVE